MTLVYKLPPNKCYLELLLILMLKMSITDVIAQPEKHLDTIFDYGTPDKPVYKRFRISYQTIINQSMAEILQNREMYTVKPLPLDKSSQIWFSLKFLFDHA